MHCYAEDKRLPNTLIHGSQKAGIGHFLLTEGPAWSCSPCSEGRREAVDVSPGTVGNSHSCTRGNGEVGRLWHWGLGQGGNSFWFGPMGKATETWKTAGKAAVQVTFSLLRATEAPLVLFPRRIRKNCFWRTAPFFFFFLRWFCTWAYKFRMVSCICMEVLSHWYFKCYLNHSKILKPCKQ